MSVPQSVPKTAAPAPTESASPSVPPAEQLTPRAILTGVVLGAAFAVCNIYAGLKVGLVFNMAIAAALLGWGLWTGVHQLSGRRTRALRPLENNVIQAIASAAALIASAGLVGPLPALAIMTGKQLSWLWLTLWLACVCLLGIVVAVGLRRQIVEVQKLPLAVGVATAETLRELHAVGGRALERVLALLGAGVVAAGLKFAEFRDVVRAWPFPGRSGGLRLSTLSFSLDPTLLLYGIGGLIGTRAGLSLLLGAVLAWGLLLPPLIHAGLVQNANFTALVTARPDAAFGVGLRWLLWPGVVLMVVSGLVSFAWSWRSAWTGLSSWARGLGAGQTGGKSYAIAVLLVLALCVTAEVFAFGITWWAALLSFALAFVLAIVAGRVSGETAMTPVAPISKVAQVTLGLATHATPAPNLMATSLSGGAASQCADLLHDLKCAQLIGASLRVQVLSQLLGAATGAACGALAYLLLIRDPATQLMTADLPATGVVGSKAIAELLVKGGQVLPDGTPLAMLIAAAVGVLLPVAEKLSPKAVARWLPSAPSLGMAFVLPAGVSLALCIGAVVAWLLQRWCKSWSSRFLVTICTGLVAGDTLTGVATGIYHMLATARG